MSVAIDRLMEKRQIRFHLFDFSVLKMINHVGFVHQRFFMRDHQTRAAGANAIQRLQNHRRRSRVDIGERLVE